LRSEFRHAHPAHHVLANAATFLLEGDERRVVLGARDDGGYYLLGMRAPHAGRFKDIAWSTDTVAAVTRERAWELGLELIELPYWHDVDDAASLARLFSEAGGYAAPFTRQTLSELGIAAMIRPPSAETGEISCPTSLRPLAKTAGCDGACSSRRRDRRRRQDMNSEDRRLSKGSAGQGGTVKAILFDAYGTLFDTHSVRDALEAAFPGRGDYLTQIWRLKQLEYSWLRGLSGDYKHFGEVTRDALRYSLCTLGVVISPERLEALVCAYDSLRLFPDALAALDGLASMRLSVLSNGSPAMLAALLNNAGILDRFEEVISVDDARTFKPSPHVYRLACTRLNLAPEEILLVSSNGFDLHGGFRFGLRTARIERQPAARLRMQLARQPIGPVEMFAALRTQSECLSSEPDLSIPSLLDLREAILTV